MSDIRDQRFHLFPENRIKVVAILGATVGGFQGFYEGIKISSLRYLTENGHRLPQKVGGWYFYHKKKNYVMLLDGVKGSFILATRTALLVTGFFGLEHGIDKFVRQGTIDFLNTTAAAMILGGIFGAYQKLSRRQVWNNMKRGGLVGLSLGITHDLLIWTRGGRVWYLDQLGIKNPRFDADGNAIVV